MAKKAVDNPVAYIKSGAIFFQEKRVPKKRKVMNYLGVKPRTFAGNLVYRLYDYYFAGAVNFKKEYKRYYKKEFDSVEQFIEEHFNLWQCDAVCLAKGDYSMKECSRKSIERNIETINYDRWFKTAFSEAVGGIRDEDEDGVYYE